MPATYTCKCQDGRSLTGTAKWTPAELKGMNAVQIAQALSEIREFARYYAANFYYPKKQLEEQLQTQLHQYQRARRWTIILGSLSTLCTILWIFLAVNPASRFSKPTMIMAVMTFLSIIALIPVLFWFISSQENYSKKYPKTLSKLEQLNQEQEKEIFGTYADYLVTGYVLSPEYGLHEEGLDFLIKVLASRKVSNLAEATMLCKKKLGRSPVPQIILSLNTASSRAHASRSSSAAKMHDITKMENQGPDWQTILQLSDYLHSALQDYSSQAAVSSILAEEAAELSLEEKDVLNNYRSLSEDEKKRVRRVIHSLLSGQY